MARIAFNSVFKSYPPCLTPLDRLRELLRPAGQRGRGEDWALRDVSFEAREGETLCLVGANGSGKSTTLRLAAGILAPTGGSVEVRGRVAALLELGAGFHPEFTGRENARLSAALFGLSGGEFRKVWPRIEAFAEIGDSVNRPVRSYSSGMLLRLAFAVAIHVEPEVLLVDEALAVGDHYFRQRCMRKVHQLRSRRVTILFVSHSMADVQALGTRALWLDGGRIAAEGSPSSVARQYLASMNARERVDAEPPRASSGPAQAPSLPPDPIPNVDHRFGTRRAEVTGIRVLGPDGRRAAALRPRQRSTVQISVRARERIASPIVGFMLRNHLGIDFAGTNTAREGVELAPLEAGSSLTVGFRVELPDLYAGSFSLSPAVSDGRLGGYEICDWIENAVVLPLERGEGEVYGYLHLPCTVEVRAGAARGRGGGGP